MKKMGEIRNGGLHVVEVDEPIASRVPPSDPARTNAILVQSQQRLQLGQPLVRLPFVPRKKKVQL